MCVDSSGPDKGYYYGIISLVINMKSITGDADYAVRALCLMAEHKEEIIPVSELAGELKIPKPFLRKILQILNKEELLKSAISASGKEIPLKEVNIRIKGEKLISLKL